jgi:uncharacterized membrane protein YozB (DUF420 family)
MTTTAARPVTRPRATWSRSDWLVPLGLVLLSLVPVAAGGVRVTELASGPEVTPDNARFVSDPIPVVVHVVSVTVYSLLGAFQFSGAIRRRHPRWHRVAGRVLLPAGLGTAASGIWMTLFYDLPPHDGAVLGAMRLAVGTGMIAALVLGVRAIRRRDVPTHMAWMIRAYALAMGAGTQVFTTIPVVLFVGGGLGAGAKAVAMGAGWGINIVVAEWVIRRSRRASRPRATIVIPVAAP